MRKSWVVLLASTLLSSLILAISGAGAAPVASAILAKWNADDAVQVPPRDAGPQSVSLSVIHAAAAGASTESVDAGCTTTALVNDASTSGNERAPNLRNRFGRSVYLILATEMAAAGITSGTQLSGIGWNFSTSPGLSGSNNLIVYMQNTADVANNKSTTWATAITGMTTVHNASVAVPNVTGTWDFAFSGGSPFTYTGGGLYVAFDAQYPVGTLSTTAVISCNSTGLVNGLKGAQSNAANPTTVATSSFRPETRLTPTAGFANDAAVDLVQTLGDFPLNVGSPHVVRAVVTNKGTSALTNVQVALSITGANANGDTQIVPSLAACGGQAVVSFAPFTPTALGSNTVAVSVPPDDNSGNNSQSKPLDVTPVTYSYKYPGSTSSGGVGFTGATGQFVGKFSTVTATSVASVIVEFFAATATAYRVVIYGDDGTGLPGAQLYADAADRTVAVAGSQTITLPAPVSVGPGNFFVGVEQTNTTNGNYSFDVENPIRGGSFFLSLALNTGPWTDFAPGNNFKLNIGLNLFSCSSNAQCDDGNLCTNDVCVSGTCQHSSAVNCNDNDPCTIDTCDAATGTCQHAPDPCDDSNPCTYDACSSSSGCSHTDVCQQLCGGAITILDATSANPYPASISVAGIPGNAQLAKVHINGLTHSFVADVDVMLEGPGGQNAIILSDVGGADGVSNVNVTLADSAATPLPGAAFPSGEYQPTNLTTGDTFPTPAPSPSANTALASFTNGANGTWNLWVVDDANLDTGSVSTWCLDFRVTCTSAADCDDANSCTADSCQNGLCVHGPSSCFPPAGTDLSPTTGIFHVDVNGLGPRETAVSGMTLLQWGNATTNSSTGLHTVQTELRSMDLHGSAPGLGSLVIRGGADNGLPPSLGRVDQIALGGDFPASAFFDVFFEVEVNGTTTLRNSEPLRMEATITEIPPRSIGLRNASPVLITNTLDPTQVSVVRTAQHWMCPPPFPPAGVPCPVPCNRSPFPVCGPGDCPGTCSISGNVCRSIADCPAGQTCVGVKQCVANNANDTCECKSGFPTTGTDLSPTTGIFRVGVTGLGTVDTSVAGNTRLQWQNPVTDPGTGLRTVQTELLSLDLTGSDPTLGSLHVLGGSQNGLPSSLGSVTQNDPGGADFPAHSFFDVFFEIQVNGTTTLRNSQPLVMQADITEIPPRSIGLRNAAPVQIRDLASPGQIHVIQTAEHWMCPPPFPPPGVPCPVPCDQSPYPACGPGTCPTPSQHCRPLSPFFDQDGLQGRCVCVNGFPPAGTDTSPTVGTFHVDLSGVGPVETTVSGQTLLQWQNPVVGPGGQRTVQTEMVSLDLAGSDPSIGSLNIQGGSAHGLPPSTGSVVPVAAGSDFPALATFNVFFQVVVNGTTTLVNDQPLVMRAPITEIPPRSIGLQNLAPVPLRNLANPAQVNTIQTAQHWMCPPPFPPPGVPCPVPCERNPFPVCKLGTCAPDATGTVRQCMPDRTTRACRCAKPTFPSHGVDLSPTSGLFRVNIAGVGVADAEVSGQVLLRWQDPVTGPGGQHTVQTEMVSLDLTGTSPTLGTLHVTGGSSQGLPASNGQVTPVASGSDFPANAFFDVFFKVQAGGQTLVNDQPLHMQAEITEIPPRSIALRNAAPVPLRNVNNPGQSNQIQTAAHWMCPPPYQAPGIPCPVACNATPQPLCSFGACPSGLVCTSTSAGACGCVAPPPPVSGDVPDGSPGVPLRVGKAAGGQITLTWGASCLTSDTDYGIFEGSVPNYYTHTARVCTTGGLTTKTLTPSSGGRYYLVVPQQASVEGSYGQRSNLAQRPQGVTPCLPQAVSACP